jgi:protein phosphatase
VAFGESAAEAAISTAAADDAPAATADAPPDAAPESAETPQALATVEFGESVAESAVPTAAANDAPAATADVTTDAAPESTETPSTFATAGFGESSVESAVPTASADDAPAATADVTPDPAPESTEAPGTLATPAFGDFAVEDAGPTAPAAGGAPAAPVDVPPSPTSISMENSWALATAAFSEPLIAVGVPPRLRIAASAVSDVGCVRTNNEDSFGYDEELGIYAVCDGMGGMASGEVASSRAVAAIVNNFADSASSGIPVSTRLLHAISAANQDVWENGQVPENKGMGTTAVVAARDGDKLVFGNVGDSRAYIIQGGQCVQLTVDHSYVNELIRNGTLTIETAQTANLQGMENVITRALGAGAEVQPDFYSIDLVPGTAALLTTDGLTRYLLQDEIAAILNASPFELAAANLIEVAKQRGGQDNVTCILLLAISS